jgi:hypothetical protein
VPCVGKRGDLGVRQVAPDPRDGLGDRDEDPVLLAVDHADRELQTWQLLSELRERCVLQVRARLGEREPVRVGAERLNDARDRLRRDAGLVGRPEPQHALEGGVVRQSLARSRGPQPAGELREHLRDVVGVEQRVQQRERAHAVRVIEREADADRAAEVVDREVDTVDPERVEEATNGGGEERQVVRHVRGLRGHAEAGEVKREDALPAGDRGHHPTPQERRRRPAVQQQDRRAATGLSIGERAAVDPDRIQRRCNHRASSGPRIEKKPTTGPECTTRTTLRRCRRRTATSRALRLLAAERTRSSM